MKLRCISLVFALVLTLPAVASPRRGQHGAPDPTPLPVPVVPEVFQTRAPVIGSVEHPSPVAVPLTQELLPRCTPGLADLRLFDGADVAQPYVIHADVLPAIGERTERLKPLDYQEVDGASILVMERPDPSRGFDALEIQTGDVNFKKQVVVEVSDDKKTWEELGRDTLFDYSARIDLRKTRIDLPESQARYLRLTVSDDVAPTSDGAWELRYERRLFQFKLSRGVFRYDAIRAFSADERDRSTTWERRDFSQWKQELSGQDTIIDLGEVNLPIESLELAVTTPYYYRQVEVWTRATAVPPEGAPHQGFSQEGGGVVYRIPGMKEGHNRVSLSMGQRRFVRLKVINLENPPLEIERIELRWMRQSLFFVAEPQQSYTLYCGNPDIKAARYDAAHLLPADSSMIPDLQRFALGAVEANPRFDKVTATPGNPLAEKQKTEKAALMGVVALVALVLGTWAVKLLRQLPPTPPKEM